MPVENLPKDDQTNWLFLVIGTTRFSFIYKIEKPETAHYNEPFIAFIHFIFPELINGKIAETECYEIMRAEEVIGTCKTIARNSSLNT